MGKSTAGNWICGCSCFLTVFFPTRGFSDFVFLNALVEVGVVAGDASDGFGGHELSDVFLSVMDGEVGTPDYQYAEALFVLDVQENTAQSDYLLTYDSQVQVMTGGIGNAAALGNGIIVFSLTEEFEVSSLLGDTTLFDSTGTAVEIQQGSPLLLSAGNYSLSFGSSALIQNGDTNLIESNSQSGLLSFNTTAIPEPGLALLTILLVPVCVRRVKRKTGTAFQTNHANRSSTIKKDHQCICN